MEISNKTFSAIIRKYENEIETKEAEQTANISSDASQAQKEFAVQQCLQTQSVANSEGDFL